MKSLSCNGIICFLQVLNCIWIMSRDFCLSAMSLKTFFFLMKTALSLKQFLSVPLSNSLTFFTMYFLAAEGDFIITDEDEASGRQKLRNKDNTAVQVTLELQIKKRNTRRIKIGRVTELIFISHTLFTVNRNFNGKMINTPPLLTKKH